MQLIKRAGPPHLSEARGHTFVWIVPLSAEPSRAWIEAFRNPRESTSVCHPSRVTISPRDPLLVFEILEDEETDVATWVRLIDRWIWDANAAVVQRLSGTLIPLEPASDTSVDLLVRWTLDPVAQGPHKRVPEATPAELRQQFLASPDRTYFLLRRASDGKPLGRFYYRAWRFHQDPDRIDWELNILIATPEDRGKGYGTEAQHRVSESLLRDPRTCSVFAYTAAVNLPERRALLKAGFQEVGPLPSSHYRIPVPHGEWVVYARQAADDQR